MDPTRFDRLTKALTGSSTTGTRRGLLRLLLALPLPGAFPALFAGETAVARRQRHGQRKRAHDPRRRQRARDEGKKGKGKKGRKGNDKQKSKSTCARAGQAPQRGQACCAGLSLDAGGRCAAPAPPSPGCLGPSNTSATQGLQEAIDAAAAGNILTLCAGTWLLTETVEIFKRLTLVGAGAGQTILDGQNLVRVLDTQEDTGTGVRLRDLTITRGNFANGGGIVNAGTLTLTGVAVTGSTAAEYGGGIENSGTLTLQNGTRVTGNTATGFGGGGIDNSGGSVTLQDGSRVSGNTAATEGGGIYNDHGTVTLEAGSIVGGDTLADVNMANWGGGIYNEAGTVTLQNGCRVSGNAAISGGAGIRNDDTLNVADEALVCNNTSPGMQQCGGNPPSTGQCPNPANGICPT
jgi:hypothetical protein